MNALTRLPLRTKITLGVTSIAVMLAVPLMLVVSRMASEALVDEGKKRGMALAQGLAARVAEPLLSRDLLQLKNMVDEVAAVEDGVYAFLLDTRGAVLVHSYPYGFPTELRGANPLPSDQAIRVQLLETEEHQQIYDFAAQVQVSGVNHGIIRVGLSNAATQAVVSRLVFAIFSLAGAAGVVGVLLATFFARQVTRRLGILRRQAEEVVKGNLEGQPLAAQSQRCWELRHCGREACPAHGRTDRRCWQVRATQCAECAANGEEATDAGCRHCAVYQTTHGDEIEELAATFDVMTDSLRKHIGNLKAAEGVLVRQKSLLDTMFDVSPDHIALLDEGFRFQAANKSLATFFDLRPDEVVGMTDRELLLRISPAAAQSERAQNLVVAVDGEPLDREVQLSRQGQVHRFHVVKVPVRSDFGRITGILHTARDLTDFKKMQEQLIQAQKMESLGKLAGGVAHEINTPLGIILGYAQLLVEDAPSGSQLASDLAIIEKQTQVCRKIVADLLKFSRQAGSEKREMCFNNSVLEAVELVRHSFSLDKVRILVGLDERMPIIYGDPDKLKQVWINLLTNARDAMPQGGDVLVRSRLDPEAKTITAWLGDSGTGMSLEVQQRIFDPFFTTKPVGQGTGLGLSVSFGIIQDHKGQISVTSPVSESYWQGYPATEPRGPGAVFTVVLPLDHQADEESEANSAQGAE